MDDSSSTIGLTALLDEVSADVEALRKKHPGDYSLKNVTLWWELERERVLARHNPGSIVKKAQTIQRLKRFLLWSLVGWCAAALHTTLNLLLR